MIRKKKKTKTEQEKWVTTLRSRINTVKKLKDDHFVIHGQLCAVITWLETKDSYMQARFFKRNSRIKELMKECHHHWMEASRLMREIREQIELELCDREEEHERAKNNG